MVRIVPTVLASTAGIFSLAAGVAALLASLGTSPAALAQELTCADIAFNSITTHEFPNVVQSCHSVVERDGRLYVRLVADVVRIRGEGSMTLDFKAGDGSRFRQEFNPSSGFYAIINGERRSTRNLVRGQEIRVYLPADRWDVIEEPGE